MFKKWLFKPPVDCRVKSLLMKVVLVDDGYGYGNTDDFYKLYLVLDNGERVILKEWKHTGGLAWEHARKISKYFAVPLMETHKRVRLDGDE